MKRSIGFLLVVAAILAAHMVFGDGHEMARGLAAEGVILPLEEVLEKVHASYPGRVLEVELEDEDDQLVYEIEILNASGEVWKVYVNAATGEILSQEQED
jgi:uncharacterized membrane protein YkoI